MRNLLERIIRKLRSLYDESHNEIEKIGGDVARVEVMTNVQRI